MKDLRKNGEAGASASVERNTVSWTATSFGEEVWCPSGCVYPEPDEPLPELMKKARLGCGGPGGDAYTPAWLKHARKGGADKGANGTGRNPAGKRTGKTQGAKGGAARKTRKRND